MRLLFLFALSMSALCADQVVDVDFQSAIGVSRLGREFLCHHPRDKVRIDLYEQVWQQRRPGLISAQKEKIPKIIHQIWLHNHPLPKEYKTYQQSWKTLNTQWQYRLWTLADVDGLPKAVQGAIERAESLQEKEDFLRLYLLANIGGVCVDVASRCIKPLDGLSRRYHFFACLEPPLPKAHFSRRMHVGTSFVGACPNHPIIQEWGRQIEALYTRCEHADTSIVRAAKRPKKKCWLTYLLFGASCDSFLSAEGYCSIILPPTVAYPIRPEWAKEFEKRRAVSLKKKMKDLFVRCFRWKEEPLFSNIRPETISIHTLGGTWAECNPKKPKREKT